MKLKVVRTIKNKIIRLDINTQCFTETESEMLEQLGEPIINFEKSYGNNVIKFSKKIKSNFKVTVKFDASLEDDMDKTAEYVMDFVDDLEEMLSEAMAELNDEYILDVIPKEDIREIKY